MKKLLSILGVFSISATAGASVFAIPTTATKLDHQNKNTLSFGSSENVNKFQMADFKKAYDGLSESEKTNVANEMKKLSQFNLDEIGQYLGNSKIDFVRDNKQTIENMYLLYSSMTKISEKLSVSAQALDVDWVQINNFIALDFGASNDYTPAVSTYGPEHWWTAVWDWGWKIDFPEGDINVMRVVNLVVSLYDGINFEPLQSLISSGKNLFDYIVNLDQHDDDKMSVLYDLLINTANDFKNSGVPFNDQLYDTVDQFTKILAPFKNLKVQSVKGIIKLAVENQLGISLEQIGLDYSGYLDQALAIIGLTNDVLEVIQDTIPGIVWNFILDSVASISTQMVDADLNHNGVSLKFQQFIIPLGFEAQ